MPKKTLIGIIAEAVAVTVMVAMAVAGCTQGRPEKYTGPVEKITVAAAAYLTEPLFMLLKIRDTLKKMV